MASVRGKRLKTRIARRFYLEFVLLIAAISCLVASRLPDSVLSWLFELLRQSWHISGWSFDVATAERSALDLIKITVGFAFALPVWLFVHRFGLLHGLANAYSRAACPPAFLRVWTPADAETNRLDFRHKTYPHVGRAHELAVLRGFAFEAETTKRSSLRSSGRFSWLWLKGPGGIGKSRLALEIVHALHGYGSWRTRLKAFFLRPLRARIYDCGFFDAYYVDGLHEWQPRVPTLFVFDDEAVRATAFNATVLLLQLLQELPRKAKRYPIRLLIIERDQPVTFADQDLLYQYGEPIELLPLKREDSISLVNQVFHTRWGHSSNPSSDLVEKILAIGQDNPFWLILAAESYRGTKGQVNWSDRHSLIDERVKTHLSKLAATYHLPSECHAVIFLATLTRGISLSSVDPQSTLFQSAIEGKREYFRRIYGPKGDTFIPPVTPDLFGCFYLLTYLDRVETGIGLPDGVKGAPSVPPLDIRMIRRMAFALAPEHSSLVVAQARELAYRTDLLELLDPPLELDSCDIEDVCWWLAVTAQVLASRDVPLKGKNQRYEQIKSRVDLVPQNEQCRQWLGVVLATYAQVLRAEFMKHVNKRGTRSRTVRRDLEEVQFAVTKLSELVAWHPKNITLGNAYSSAVLAAFAFSVNLGPGSATNYFQLLQHLSTFSSASRRAYAQGLAIALARKFGDVEKNLKTVKGLCREDEGINATFAQALVSAIHQRVGNINEHFDELAALASRDAAYLWTLAEARRVAVEQSIGNIGEHLAELSRLAAGNSRFQVFYARALVCAIATTWGDIHDHLRKLEAMSGVPNAESRLLGEYADGLAAVVKFRRARDADGVHRATVTREERLECLERLKRLVIEAQGLLVSRDVEVSYAKALFQALNQQLGPLDQFLSALREEADSKKTEMWVAWLARGLSIAIYFSEEQAAGRYFKELNALEDVPLSDEDALNVLRDAIVRGCRTAIDRALGSFDEHLSRCIEFADRDDVGKATASKLVAGLASFMWLGSDSNRAERLRKLARGKVLKGEGKAQLLANLASFYGAAEQWSKLEDCRLELERLCRLRRQKLVRDAALHQACRDVPYVVAWYAKTLAEESFWLVAKKQAVDLSQHIEVLRILANELPRSPQVQRSYYRVIELAIVSADLRDDACALAAYIDLLTDKVLAESSPEGAASAFVLAYSICSKGHQDLITAVLADPIGVNLRSHITARRVAKAYLFQAELARHRQDPGSVTAAVAAIRVLQAQNPGDVPVRSTLANALALAIQVADGSFSSLKRESLFDELTQLVQLYRDDARLSAIYNRTIAHEIAANYNDVDLA